MPDIKAVFEEHDTDGNGKIDLVEFREIAAKLGLALDRAEAEALFDEVDADETGLIEFEEFSRWYRDRATRVL